MRKLTFTLLSILVLSLSVSGCKKDDEETVYSSSCYISSFTLGSMKRLVHTTTESGADSTFYVTFTGSYYPTVIDQREQTILLRDSLPTGTRTDAVLVTVSFEGVLLHQPWTDVPSDDDWVTYSSTDSIDFSVARRFRVIPSDGIGQRDYYVRLDVRTLEPDAYTWGSMPGADALDGRVAIKAIPWGQTLYVLGSDPAGQAYSTTNYLNSPVREWTDTPCTGLPATTDVRSLQAFGGSLWVSDASGHVYRSADGTEWQAATPQSVTAGNTEALPAEAQIQLIAASDRALYARVVLDGTVYAAASADGLSWTAMETDEDSSLFPAEAASLAYVQANGNHRVLLVGTESPTLTAVDRTCAVWSLLEGRDEPWTYFPEGSAGAYGLPRMSSLSILSYAGVLIAIGSKAGENAGQHQTACYVSKDNGITWKTDSNLTVPTTLATTDSPLAAFTHGEHIWLLAGGQVWRARLNSYGSDE